MLKLACSIVGLWCAPLCDDDFIWTHMSNGQEMCWPTGVGMKRINDRCAAAYEGKVSYRPNDLCSSDPHLMLKD